MDKEPFYLLEKTCHCHTCDKWFHPLGIMRHRAMHRDRNENCKITYTDGDTYWYWYGDEAKHLKPIDPAEAKQ